MRNVSVSVGEISLSCPGENDRLEKLVPSRSLPGGCFHPLRSTVAPVWAQTPSSPTANRSANQEAWLRTGHPLGLIYEDVNKGRKPLCLAYIQGLRFTLNGNIQPSGSCACTSTLMRGILGDGVTLLGPRRWIIMCQLLEKQLFSADWT